MNNQQNQGTKGPGDTLPNWKDCDVFCIEDYAGAGHSRCGWRGRFHEATRADSGTKLVCPRCGQATLLRIPIDQDNVER